MDQIYSICFYQMSDITNAIDKGLVFFKLNSVVITEDNLQENLHITSLVDSPLASLYGNLHKVPSTRIYLDSPSCKCKYCVNLN